jgi:hypothetical protein
MTSDTPSLPQAHAEDDTALLFRADLALGRGDARAWVLLVLRQLRVASILLILVGTTVSVVTGRLEQTEGLTTASGLVSAVRSPLVVLAAGIVLRLALGPAAFLAALEVVVRDDLQSGAIGRRRWGTRLLDRFRLTNGLQSLRWTLAVRYEAVRRLGFPGRVMTLVEIALRVALGLAVVALVASLFWYA